MGSVLVMVAARYLPRLKEDTAVVRCHEDVSHKDIMAFDTTRECATYALAAHRPTMRSARYQWHLGRACADATANERREEPLGLELHA